MSDDSYNRHSSRLRYDQRAICEKQCAVVSAERVCPRGRSESFRLLNETFHVVLSKYNKLSKEERDSGFEKEVDSAVVESKYPEP